jgi:NTE family protein
MTTAYVLSGGGSLGAVQVGMLQALTERGESPDLLIGTSAGAINATYVAGHGTRRASLDTLADLWGGLRRRDVFPLSPGRHLLALLGRRESMFCATGLRRLLTTHLPYELLQDATIPVHVVATNLLSGQEVLLSTGNVVSAVLASTAVPGLLPAVPREGLTLVDGGLANNTAISQAVALGADRIFVLPAGVACALETPPSSPYATALHALSFLTQQRLIHDVTVHSGQADLHLLPPLCPLAVSSADFTHGRELVDRARRAAGSWLDDGHDQLPHPERFLSLHQHTSAASPRRRKHLVSGSATTRAVGVAKSTVKDMGGGLGTTNLDPVEANVRLTAACLRPEGPQPPLS